MAMELRSGLRTHFVSRRSKYTLAFKHDPSRQALLFYARDSPPSRGSKLFRETLEDLYCLATGKKKLPLREKDEYCGAMLPYCPVDYRRMNTQALASALEKIGRMPRLREFTVCAIGRLFHEHRAYSVRFFDDIDNKVKLYPGRLFDKLLGQAFEEEGKMNMAKYMELRKMVQKECYVRHGIEVDLRYVQGMGEKRYVVFPKKITRKELRRSLVKAGIKMRLMRLRIIRPNIRDYNFRVYGRRLPTRCLIFPAGTQRTRRKRLGPYKLKDRFLPERPLD